MQLLHRRGRRWLTYLAVLTAVVAGAATAGPPAAAQPSAGTLLAAPANTAIENSYLVVLKDDKVAPPAAATSAASAATAMRTVAQRLAAGHSGQVGRVYTSALQGFEVTMDETAARRLAADPAVAHVEQNATWRAQTGGTQVSPPNRGLDRIDQPSRSLDGRYIYPEDGTGVRVYVIDSGIRATHIEVRGRVQAGVDLIDGGTGMTDCVGHGTHVAGIIGGIRHGVAKRVTLVPVRVFGCTDAADVATIVAGIDWIAANHTPGQPGIANISLSGPVSTAVDAAITRMNSRGVMTVGAAGNNGRDACQYGPANNPIVLTVGGTSNTLDDRLWPSSNRGPCVDIFAPADNIQSSVHQSDIALELKSGTSISAAFASGVAAIVWTLHPSTSAVAVGRLVTQHAAHGAVFDYTLGPNRHLYIPPVVIGTPLATYNAAVGENIETIQMVAAGGTASYAWSATGLPSGVAVNRTTGVLSGRLLGVGSYTVTVTATDTAGQTGSITAVWRITEDVCKRLC